MAKPLLTVLSDIVISYGGRTLDGPFDAEMVAIAPIQDTAVLEIGAAGGGSVITQPTEAHTITVNVHQGSKDSTYLNDAYLTWLKGVTLALPLSIINTRDNSAWSTDAAWISARPATSYSTSLVVVPWVFTTLELLVDLQDGLTV